MSDNAWLQHLGQTPPARVAPFFFIIGGVYFPPQSPRTAIKNLGKALTYRRASLRSIPDLS